MNEMVKTPSSAVRPTALLVNGQKCSIAAPAGRRLSEVLREELGLTGTKIGCNAGDCGACTVLLDGRQVCSCLVSLGQAEGRSVTTVEGLASDPRFQALQTAFVEEGAVQCGICTPGMLMAAAELASESRKLRRDEILDRMGGVLCRCTGYTKIVDALERFIDGRVDRPTLPPGKPVVGARLTKVDGHARVVGAARYGADAMPADALFLRVVRSPHAHARFRLGDVAAFVSQNPGLLRILTAGDIPGGNGFGVFDRFKDQPVLADSYVRFCGEAVAAVVGERDVIRDLDLDAFPVSWEPLAPVCDVSGGVNPDAPLLNPERPGNVLSQGRQVSGDVTRERGEHTARGTFRTSYVEHAYIEPEAGYARRIGDRIELFVSTQTPYMDRDGVAHVLGIAPERVRILPSEIGGGFGGKIDMSVQPLIAVAAWLIDRPVACVYSRLESMRVTPKRHPAEIEAELTCDSSGRLKSFVFHADFNTGPYASCGPIVANRVPIHAMGPYRVPAVQCTTRAVLTTDAIGGAFRGFGVPQSAIANEALMDELADRLGMDRLEFRLLNAMRPGDATATGQVLQSVALVECLEALRPAWQAERNANSAFNKAGGRLRRGIGIGCMWYGIGNTSQPNPSSMRIGVDRTGRITLYSGAVDIGQGANTIMVQICADALGVAPDRINLVLGDTDRTLDAGKSSASRQTFISGNAVVLAAEQLKASILRHTNAGPDARIVFENGIRVVRGDHQIELPLATMAQDDEGDVLAETGFYNPPTTDLDENHQGAPYASYAFAAQLASVEVDTLLGTVKVRKIWAAHDVGRAINPTQVEGQIQGGIAQGLGLALMEEYAPRVTDNLHNYLIPTFGDIPEIEIFLIETGEKLGPFGAKGIGEPALIPTPPAILNAITDAVGHRPRHAPVTPSRLWALMREGEAATA